VIPGVVNGVNMDDPVVINWIKAMCDNNKTILCICTGLYILARTGVLSGKNATTHYLVINDIHKKYPEINLVKNVRYVADKNIITTGGITSGIDGALYLVEKQIGDVVAQEVSDVMVHNRDSPVPPYTILPPYYMP
jgi:transcriptional regulator GlxA family with amidase domain